MGMLLTCHNKGCGTQDYHKLDKESGNVLCVSCGNPVDVTQYVKTALLAQGQIMRKAKPSMETQCPSCGSAEGPVLLKYSKMIYKVGCKKCKEVNTHLTKYFLGALRIKSDIETIDVSQVEPIEEEKAISKTVDGAVIMNKPFTASTLPAQRKPANPNAKVSEAKAKMPSVTFTEPVDDEGDDGFADNTERPKIAVPKKNGLAASDSEAKLRQKFVDKTTGDVSDELKATLQINKV